MAPMPTRRGAYMRQPADRPVDLDALCHELNSRAVTVHSLRTCGRKRRLGRGCAIAFVGLRVAPQIPSPAGPRSFSSTSVPSSWAVTRALGEQFSERPKRVDATTRKPQTVDRGLTDDSLILPESGGAKAPGSPAVDSGRRFDDMAGVEQRLIKAGLLWGVADGIGVTDSYNSQNDFPLHDAAGLRAAWDRRAKGKAFATSFVPKSGANRTGLSTQDRTAEVAIAPPPLAEQSPLRRRIRAENTFVGGWADDTGECRQGQDHVAPLVITVHAARTASSECDFRSVAREDANRWRIIALCSRAGKSWNAHVDLKLAGPNLTWSSERGTAKYLRCVKR
jgi:hypothetical protein